MRHVPEIKLIRTDTTLDLSQKAEKVCPDPGLRGPYIGEVPGLGLIRAPVLEPKNRKKQTE